MANGLMKLVLSLTGRDDGAKRLLAETERQLQRTATSRMKMARAHKPYEITGIRSEKAIQREIKLTEAAYNRLKRSGTATQNDLARATKAHKQRIAELNAELGKSSKLQKGMAIGGTALAAGTAAYAALKPAMDSAKQMDANIGQVARNAFIADSDKSAEWIATSGKAQVRSLIDEWVSKYGGNADAAAQFINAQMAQGLSFEQIKNDQGRGYLTMTATSQNGHYDYNGVASLYKTFTDQGLTGDKLARAVEKTIQSGLDGKFEIDDVVREAPGLFASMGKAGMTADKDIDYMLAWMQSGANKAATTSEAANNINNALAKVVSSQTGKNVQKHLGLDWRKEVLAGQGKGENSIEVLARLINTHLDKNKEYQSYLSKAKAGDANAAVQAETIRRELVAEIFPDLQAQSGLIAAMDFKQMQDYQAKTRATDDGKVDKLNQARMLDAAAQQEQADSLKVLRQDPQKFIEAETAFKQLTAEFPSATLALQTLAAAAMAAAAAQGLMGVLGGGGLGGGAAAVGTAARFGLVGIGAAAGGLGLWDANSRINRNEGKGFTEGGLNSRAAGYAESALSGAALGAAVGSIIPGIGTAIGAAIGAGGGLLTAAITDAWKENPPPKPAGMAAEPLQPLRPLEPLKPAEPLVPVITQQTAAYQAAIIEQTAQYQAALNEDTAAVTGGLNQINSTLAAANQTINNNMTVTLDGRVIAQEVSRYQVAMFGRGAGQ
ncbi:PRTRC system protein F [Neisseria sp. Dent CA1/247]|uniref:PRTRC system protein F n=1 Tax=Neisseria sp. Dent CA1/247 TaxID=2912675 RepID=UPI001FD15CA8|nr:PRTRC system protein F [Neisseria sp. Dent CA1/247]UOO77312.1 PRTRC system protein F [Neisseria sp. Dent CA1/247]